MNGTDRKELDSLRVFKKTTEEHIEEVDKLLKYVLEMQTVTRYQGGEKANIQKLILWTTNILKKESDNK